MFWRRIQTLFFGLLDFSIRFRKFYCRPHSQAVFIPPATSRQQAPGYCQWQCSGDVWIPEIKGSSHLFAASENHLRYLERFGRNFKIYSCRWYSTPACSPALWSWPQCNPWAIYRLQVRFRFPMFLAVPAFVFTRSLRGDERNGCNIRQHRTLRSARVMEWS